MVHPSGAIDPEPSSGKHMVHPSGAVNPEPSSGAHQVHVRLGGSSLHRQCHSGHRNGSVDLNAYEHLSTHSLPEAAKRSLSFSRWYPPSRPSENIRQKRPPSSNLCVTRSHTRTSLIASLPDIILKVLGSTASHIKVTRGLRWGDEEIKLPGLVDNKAPG